MNKFGNKSVSRTILDKNIENKEKIKLFFILK